MKKYFTYITFIIFSCLMVSCESDNDSKDVSSNEREKSIVVSGRSPDVISGVDGDIYQYNGDGWRVIVTDKTKIYVQRPSCSGLIKGSPSDVNLGYTIFFKHIAEEANYIGPNTVRASVIEAYRPECLENSENISMLIITNTSSTTQTVTTTTVTTNIIRR